jgi:hypothetical protein
MININRLEIIIAEFAKKYNFLQWKDIANVVTKSKPMFSKKQLQMDGKSFVKITECIEKNSKDKNYVLFIGKIYFTIDSSSQDEEIYSVDTDNHSFAINLSDFSDEQTLIETIIEKCKEYNHL